MHHAYGDGEKCSEMMKSLFDIEEEKVINKKSKEGYISKIWNSIYYFFISLYMTIYFLLFFKKEKILKSL